MTIYMRRLERLEAEQRTRDEAERRARAEAESRAAIDALEAWLTASASPAEQAAWQRFLLDGPVDDEQLHDVGLTRDQYNAIMAEVGACTEDDRRLVDALGLRIPPDLLDRLNQIES